jgi:hypothetical protein
MALNGTGLPNLTDYCKTVDPSGNALPVVDRLSQEQSIINDMPVYESNMEAGELFAAAVEEPTPSKRKLNQGIKASKGKDEQVFETFVKYEERSIVDESIVPSAAKLAAFRAGQLAESISSLGKGMTEEIFYGDPSKDKESFKGIALRYGDGTLANAPRTLINAAGNTAYLTSIYLIIWEKERGMFGFAPKGSKTGIDITDLTPNNKPHKIEDPEVPGAAFLGYETFLKWRLGLALKDARYCARVANIDLDSISDSNLIKLLRRATNMVESLDIGKACWYMNRYAVDRVENALDAKNNVHYTEASPTLLKMRTLHRIPIRLCDRIKGGDGKTGETKVNFV